jgi:hypothetical protein
MRDAFRVAAVWQTSASFLSRMAVNGELQRTMGNAST